MLLILSLNAAPAAAQQFVGELVLKPQPNGINMVVQNPFGFRDKLGRDWPVPAGFETDGASIPRALWTFVGSPFTGKYLPAAIVHDYHCMQQRASWQDVHLVFYDAMIAGGVNLAYAKLLYFGVYRFGPKWKTVPDFGCPTGQQCDKPGKVTKIVAVLPTAFGNEEIDAMKKDLDRGTDIDLKEIRARAEQAFLADNRPYKTRTVTVADRDSRRPGVIARPSWPLFQADGEREEPLDIGFKLDLFDPLFR
jgi:hypothetical protein